MAVKNSVKALMGKLIVSCQAYEDTPLYGSENMKIMAESAILGGAGGIRACWKEDIEAIRSITDIPIIGINKVVKNMDGGIVITPSFEDAAIVIEAGADIVALDLTKKGRSYDDIFKMLEKIRKYYPNAGIMADLSTAEEGLILSETGLVDILSSTLSKDNYSDLLMEQEPDRDIIKIWKEKTNIPVNAEGRIWELSHYKTVIDAGADMVTIGTAITRPHLTTQRFKEYNDFLIKNKIND